MDELARTEAMNVDLWKLRLQVGEQIEIPLFGQFRMMTALHQDLRPAERDRLFDLAIDFIEGDHIRVIVLFRSIKRAELTINVTDVCVVDVAIDDVGDDYSYVI